MIHYHGTPMGGTNKDVCEFVNNRHMLIPFARPDQLPVILPYCSSFIADNSAFTYWKQGGQLDVQGYISWLKTFYKHPAFDWCLIPDAIEGDEAENRKLITDWMRSGTRIKGVPVYHFHESLEHLEWLVDSSEIIALGSSGQWPTPGEKSWWKRLDEIMRVVCDAEGRPKCKLHGLRMLDHRIFAYIPLHSADSTNVAVNSGAVNRFGMYTPPTRAQRAQVIASRIEQYQSAAVWIKHQGELDL